MSGTGIITDPWDFPTALRSGSIRPGSYILLRGGEYIADKSGVSGGSDNPGKGVYQCFLQGDPDNPITIAPYQNETVRINGHIEFMSNSCQYVRLRDIEIAPTPTTRTFPDEFTMDIQSPVYVTAPGIEVINCKIHDGYLNALFGASPSLWYGNLIYNLGVYSEARAKMVGYGIYTHNQFGFRMDFKHNIFAQVFGTYGLHANSASNNVENYHVTENSFVKRSMIMSASPGIERNNHGLRNHYYEAAASYGLGAEANEDFEHIDNTHYLTAIGSCLAPQKYQEMVVTGNRFIRANVGQPYYGVEYVSAVEEVIANWDLNTYINMTGYDPFFLFGGAKTFAEWQAASGFDANSTYQTAMLTGSEVICWPNEYKTYTLPDGTVVITKREGIVVIWNWDSANSVDADLSTFGLTNGETYRLYQAQNPAEYHEFVADGNPVSVPMTGWTVATPTAWNEPVETTSFPVHGSFALEKV